MMSNTWEGSMRRLFFLLACLFAVCSVHAQTNANATSLKIKVRAALFDRDLNLKPVPRLAISLQPKAAGTSPISAQTSLDGVAEVELPAGTYQLTTSKPAELFGKQYLWDFEIQVTKADQVIELSNDNAKVTDSAGARGAHVDELVEQFQRVRGAIVTVWTEDGAVDGFLIDPAGLIVTSQKMIEGHKWIAVEADGPRRVNAEVVVEDKALNAALLRINMDPFKDLFIPPVSLDASALVEGERVFTIDNSYKRGKVLVTGVMSHADAQSIVSDVKFTDLASPLFNSSGGVVGYSRMVNKEFQIVPMNQLKDDLATARQKVSGSPVPSAHLLPVRPQGHFPVDALLSRHETRWEKDVYAFKLGEFEMEFITPVASYQYNQQKYTAEQNERTKHAKKGVAPPPLEEPAHEYDSVLVITAFPQVKMAFWKSVGDAMATNNMAPDTYRPKDSFARMRLMCGDKEVEPVLPGRYALKTGGNAYVQVDTGAAAGRYIYAPDAISPTCGKVSLELYSALKTDAPPLVKVLDTAQVERLWKDFEPYRKSVETKK
jgi:S1-C subfamily serine protease